MYTFLYSYIYIYAHMRICKWTWHSGGVEKQFLQTVSMIGFMKLAILHLLPLGLWSWHQGLQPGFKLVANTVGLSGTEGHGGCGPRIRMGFWCHVCDWRGSGDWKTHRFQEEQRCQEFRCQVLPLGMLTQKFGSLEQGWSLKLPGRATGRQIGCNASAVGSLSFLGEWVHQNETVSKINDLSSFSPWKIGKYQLQFLCTLLISRWPCETWKSQTK